MKLSVLNCPLEYSGFEAILVKHFNVGVGGFEGRVDDLTGGKIKEAISAKGLKHPGECEVIKASVGMSEYVILIAIGDPPFGMRSHQERTYDNIRHAMYIATLKAVDLNVKGLATTVHGLAFGLSIERTVHSMMDGIIEAIKFLEKKKDSFLPLKEIAIVERKAPTANIIKDAVQKKLSAEERVSVIEDEYIIHTRLLESDKAQENTLTFVNVDIARSTRIKKELLTSDPHMTNLFHDFHFIVDKFLQKSLGKDFKRDGDGGIFYFYNAEKAIQFALDLLNGTSSLNQKYGIPQDLLLALRIGIHTGNCSIDTSEDPGRISNLVIDIACHLQKALNENKDETRGLVISGETHTFLGESMRSLFNGPLYFRKDEIDVYLLK